MSGKTVSSFGVSPISSHSWSGDGNHLAISLNNNEVQVMKSGAGAGKWTTTATLNQHDLLVTGIDWSPKTNRIVTCSTDRNAYVWTLEADGTWGHCMVLLRINRAATCVKWSPEENKFAVGSGARLISICYHDSNDNWWVSKHIKKPIRSTITALDWHPNNCLLASGSTGFKVRVHSAYIKDIEDKPSPTSWGSKMPFQNLMAEFANSSSGGGWIHSVSFSGDGNRLAWVGHDSSVSIADAANGMAICKLNTNQLPLLSCVWVSPDSIIAAGHGCTPLLFKVDGSGQVTFASKLETENDNAPKKMRSARDIFEAKVTRGNDSNLPLNFFLSFLLYQVGNAVVLLTQGICSLQPGN